MKSLAVSRGRAARSRVGSIGLAAIVALTWAAPSIGRADLVIDNFSEVQAGTYTPPTGVVQTTVGSVVVTETGLSTANVIGGIRQSTLTATVLADLSSDFVNYIVSPSPSNRLSYASTNGATGNLSLFYEGSGGVTGLNADLTDGGTLSQIEAQFFAFDLANLLSMDVTVSLVDTLGNSASVTQTLTASGPQTKVFLYTGFVGVDLTSIRNITVFFDAQQSTDFTVRLLAAVPEPSSLVLAAFGGVGLIAVARARTRRAA